MKRKPTKHVTKIKRIAEDKFQAICSCGRYRSRPQTTLGRAERAAIEHKETKT